MNPEEAQRESDSALKAGGMVAGAATGAAADAGIGVLVGGPVGAMVGVGVRAVVGALGGTAATVLAQEASHTPSAPATPVHLQIEDTAGHGRPVVLIHGWP